MANKFIDKATFNNNTYDLHDTGARTLISENSTNIAKQSTAIAKNTNDITTIKADNADLHSDLNVVTSRVESAETDIDNLEAAVSKAQDDITDNSDRISAHDTKITNLEDRMDAAETEIQSLDDRTTANEDSITTLDSRVTAADQKNDEQDDKIESIKETTAQHTQDIGSIKQDLLGVHNEIDDLDDRITASTYEAGNGIYFGQGQEHTNINVEDEILDQINQNTIDITDLKGRMTDVEDDVTLIKTDITDIKGDIDDLQQDVDAIDGRVTINETDIAALKAKQYTKISLKGSEKTGYQETMNIVGLKTTKYGVTEPVNAFQRVAPTMASCASVTMASVSTFFDLNTLSDRLLINNNFDGYVHIQLPVGKVLNAPDDIGTIGVIKNEQGSKDDYNMLLLYNSYTGNDYNATIPLPTYARVDCSLRYQQLTDLTTGKVYTRSYMLSKNKVVDGQLQPIGWTEWTVQATDTTAIEESITELNELVPRLVVKDPTTYSKYDVPGEGNFAWFFPNVAVSDASEDFANYIARHKYVQKRTVYYEGGLIIGHVRNGQVYGLMYYKEYQSGNIQQSLKPINIATVGSFNSLDLDGPVFNIKSMYPDDITVGFHYDNGVITQVSATVPNQVSRVQNKMITITIHKGSTLHTLYAPVSVTTSGYFVTGIYSEAVYYDADSSERIKFIVKGKGDSVTVTVG